MYQSIPASACAAGFSDAARVNGADVTSNAVKAKVRNFIFSELRVGFGIIVVFGKYNARVYRIPGFLVNLRLAMLSPR